ncbi:MAG TPA: peptidyl-tRNA hydrolase, partial [Streptosporangiaceae bacterium]|nr:peptidyl-tRNA hydrolase [Streptosporangiaceae bacterium]
MSFGPAEPPPTKQVIVIRRDLRMRRGKEIAQGAHASMAWLRQRVMSHLTPAGVADQVRFTEAERVWLEGSLRKVTVKVGSEAELLAVYDKAVE